jgi:hypothetical protein
MDQLRPKVIQDIYQNPNLRQPSDLELKAQAQTSNIKPPLEYKPKKQSNAVTIAIIIGVVIVISELVLLAYLKK